MRARYPSYVDLDPLIDAARLAALDGYIRERLERRLAAEADLRFYTGPFVLEADAPTLPGSRLVYLSATGKPDDYYELDRCENWNATEDSAEFAELMDFIATLPFAETGRMLIMYDAQGRAVTAHRDHDSQDLCHEFVWFRTNLDKPFYLLDPGTGEKTYVRGHSAWFDTVNQYHGADATGGLSWSIRIDGRFTDAFRARMPDSSEAPASAAALWQAELEMAPA
ncbi:MAG: hypothetical protein H0V46_09040 [Sphingomonas sp.]|nr:hypothetical protein [Sphingomonas sp.]